MLHAKDVETEIGLG